MKILAVDTSCITATVAIIDEKKVIGEYSTNHKKTHSQKLLPLINQLLKDTELKIDDIDLFASAVGPGSFTGLRIGIVTIKGFAYAQNKPVIGVNTLDAMAYGIPAEMVCPMLDARNNQVYTSLYKYNDGNLIRHVDYMGVEIEKLIDMVYETGKSCAFLGDAVDIHKEKIKESLGEKAIILNNSFEYNRASKVASLALFNYSNGKSESAFDLEPFYLRKSQAERLKDRQNNG